jgi:hypothetical protein
LDGHVKLVEGILQHVVRVQHVDLFEDSIDVS